MIGRACAIGIMVAASASAAAIEVRSPRESPAVTCLQSAADGRLSAAVVRASVERAVESSLEPGQAGRLLDVLLHLSGLDKALESEIEKGLEGPSDAGDAVVSFRSQFRERSRGNAAAKLESGRNEPWFRDDSTPVEQPSRKDLNLPRPLLLGRLFRYVDSLLDRDPEKRTREAFEAAAADDCATFIGGKATTACSDIGLDMLRYASLWLGVMDLKASRGDERVIARYLRLESSTAEKAMLAGRLSNDTLLAGWVGLVERWRMTPPSRLRAWADIEALSE